MQGIYKLTFEGTSKVYIGQSTNCTQRLATHLSSLRKGASPKKLQEAYNTYGAPSMSIILEVPEVLDLNTAESKTIDLYDSVTSGFNTTTGGSTKMYGEHNGQANYLEEDYWNVLYFLSEPGYSWKQISYLTGVSEYVISHISSLEAHGWLKEKYPELYKKVEDIRNSETGRKSAFMQGIAYPKVISPEGVEYTVKHCTNFAKEHGLLQPKLHEVLKGTRKHHRGWHLAGYIKEEDYPIIISPEGLEYSIPFNGCATFAREHGLTHPLLHRVLRGQSNSHKGWRLLKL